MTSSGIKDLFCIIFVMIPILILELLIRAIVAIVLIVPFVAYYTVLYFSQRKKEKPNEDV